MKLMGTSWSYISEGNAHIVIQLKGTNYILRLIKEGRKPILPERVQDSLDFVNLVMVPLLKNFNYGVAEIFNISECNLNQLIKDLHIYRPKERLEKSIVNHSAIKTANLSIVSVDCRTNYCVEIKPKEGFISSGLKMYSKCYYCLKQYYKLHNSDVKEISAYCPLDLFSGDKIRMRKCLLNMIKTPQNNFKFFMNGKLYDYNKLCGTNMQLGDCPLLHSPELFIDFIIKVLLSGTSVNKNVLKEIERKSPELTKDTTMKLCNECSSLKPNNLLYNLLKLQQLSEISTLKDLEIPKKDYDYVHQILKQLKTRSLDLNVKEDRDTFFSTAGGLNLALIAAVAKDCSIMISFTTDYVENIPYIDIEYLSNEKSRLYYKVALTDLEPKPITTLLKRKQTEKQLINIYEKHIQLSIKYNHIRKPERSN